MLNNKKINSSVKKQAKSLTNISLKDIQMTNSDMEMVFVFFFFYYQCHLGSPICHQEVQIKTTSCHYWRRQWHPTPVLLPGNSPGWRILVGCSPWGHEESDTTERLHFHFSLSCIGEGNGNPLQCSCLENPRGGGAWWAAIYGVAQSWTRLKRLSSSSSNPGSRPLLAPSGQIESLPHQNAEPRECSLHAGDWG